MKIQEKIEKIMGEYVEFVNDDTDYFVEPKDKQKWSGFILSLIRKEIESVIPKEDYDENISDIRTALKERGIL